MIEKKCMFKKVIMEGSSVKSSTEINGTIMDKFTDSREKGGKMVQTDYYLIADESGVIHQVRPFNVIKLF